MGDNCVIFYKDSDYRNQLAKICATDVPANCEDKPGRCSKLTALTAIKNDSLSSVKIDEGVRLTLFKDANYLGDSAALDKSLATFSDDWKDQTSSWKIHKNCSHRKWTWDKECETDQTTNINYLDQIKNREAECSYADLTKNTNCMNWCADNQASCPTAVSNYIKLPFPKVDYGKYKKIYDSPEISRYPDTVIVLRTAPLWSSTFTVTAIIGSMDVLPLMKGNSYSNDDLFWKRLINASANQPSIIMSNVFAVSKEDVIKGVKKDIIDPDILFKIYDVTNIPITGRSIPTNALLFTKTKNVDSIINYVKTLGPVAASAACGGVLDLCYDPVLKYVSSAGFDKLKHDWCDIVSNPTSKDNAYFNESQALAVRQACNMSYCAIPSNRFKSTFTNDFIVRLPTSQLSREIFTHNQATKESYSENCTNVCSTAPVGSPLYAACRYGTKAYCSLNSNILTQECLNESAKDPDIQSILKTWCSANPTDPNYLTYCSNMPVLQPIPQTTPTTIPQTTPTTIPPATQTTIPPATNSEVKSSDPSMQMSGDAEDSKSDDDVKKDEDSKSNEDSKSDEDSEKGLSTAELAGIISGIVGFIVIIVLIVVFAKKRKAVAPALLGLASAQIAQPFVSFAAPVGQIRR